MYENLYISCVGSPSLRGGQVVIIGGGRVTIGGFKLVGGHGCLVPMKPEARFMSLHYSEQDCAALDYLLYYADYVYV